MKTKISSFKDKFIYLGDKILIDMRLILICSALMFLCSGCERDSFSQFEDDELRGSFFKFERSHRFFEVSPRDDNFGRLFEGRAVFLDKSQDNSANNDEYMGLFLEIMKFVESHITAKDLDKMTSEFGLPLWDRSIVYKSNDMSVMAVPTLAKNTRNVVGVLFITAKDGGLHINAKSSELVKLGSNAEAKAALSHFNYDLFGTTLNTIRGKSSSDCDDPYYTGVRRRADCWVYYSVINCVFKVNSVECDYDPSGGLQDTPSTTNDTESTGGGANGPGTNSGGGNSGDGGENPITVSIFDHKYYSDEYYERLLNCPKGSFHSIKNDILADTRTPYCSNPDVHLEPNKDIVLVCPRGNDRTPVYTGINIFVYSCE